MNNKLSILIGLLMWSLYVEGQTTPCVSAGTIEMKETANELLFAYTELPYFDCEGVAVSERVIWWGGCNAFNTSHRQVLDTLNIGDTLRLDKHTAGFRFVFASYEATAPEIVEAGYWSASSNTAYYHAPDAPVASLDVVSNSAGYINLKFSTNAFKQRVRVVNYRGFERAVNLYGSCEHQITLPANSPGVYWVIVDWYFQDACSPVVRSKQGITIF